MRWPALLLVAALSACQAAVERPRLPHGDEIAPGAIEAVGLSYCEAARLELAAIVLDEPPRAASLSDVADARAPGCTWVAIGGDARVRLNVFDADMRRITGAGTPAAQYDRLAAHYAHGRGPGTEMTEMGVRAARFGFDGGAPGTGAILVETPDRVLEFQGWGVHPAKLAVFASEVTLRLAQPEG